MGEKFIFRVVSGYLEKESSDFECVNKECIQTFLEEPSVVFLSCKRTNDNKITFTNQVESVRDGAMHLIFLKMEPVMITQENIQTTVTVSSVTGSAVHNFYQYLKELYAPLFLKLDCRSSTGDPKMQTVISELISNLASFLKEYTSSHSVSILSLSDEVNYWRRRAKKASRNSSSEKDRAELFMKLLEPAANECARFESASQLVMSSSKDFASTVEQTGLGSVLTELLNILDPVVFDVLDETWRCLEPAATKPFPESRMRELIEAMGYWVVRVIQYNLGGITSENRSSNTPVSLLWTHPFSQVKSGLQLGIDVCEQWQKCSNVLTQQIWRRFTPHPWEGSHPDLSYLAQFKSRLNEVLQIRGLYEHLRRLLTDSELVELGMSAGLGEFLFTQNSGTENSEVPAALRQLANPLNYNPYTAEQWLIGKSLVDMKFNAAEERAAIRLRTKLLTGASGDVLSDKNNVNLILHEFHKYQDLIRRPRVSAALQSERETLLGYLEASVKEFREEFLIGSGSNTDKTAVTGRSSGLVTAKNIPEQVNRMLWAGQLESRAREDLEFVESLLSDLARYPAYKQEVTSLIEEMSSWRREQFESWSRSNLARLDGQGGPGSLSFDPSRPILNLSAANGCLEVGFPEALVQLQREVRLLVGLGYAVPMKLIHAADQAEALHRYAIVLKQVAHFYNSIDSQMIPSQQALMLNSAMAFERLIKSPKTHFRLPPSDGNQPKETGNTITWNQTEELESYINQLQTASRQLMMENRKLRKVHFTVMEKIIRLLDVDLLRNQSRWRNELADVRYMLTELANQGGYPADHMAPWKAHLDRQLYKVLEYQYRIGLDEINERMPEIRVDMVYQQSRLAFKPPFEEIKAKYYREIRKFICIPNYFRGVSDLPVMARDMDNSELPELIFPLILDNQSNGLRVCYRKAEFLFTRLIASLDQFRNWVVLGSVNLDELVDSHCRDLADFERNFRALKTRGRDAEKLPAEIKIDCVTVNCLPVKNAIEGMLQNLFETLQTCLRRSIHGELVAADAFLTDALDKLSYRPQTVDELSEAKAREVEFSKARSRLVEQVTCAEAKDRLLRGVAGSGVQALGATKAKWDKFQLMMESFRMMMNEQLEVMKSNVEARTKNYVNSLEKFASRWHQLKPGHELLDSGDREACKAAIHLVRERQTEFTELEALRESVIRDHVHFEMTPPSFELAEELATDLKTYESMWSEFEAFNKGIEEFAREDWISFRTKYYLFDEFLASWFNKLRAAEVTPMTVCLQKAIDQYRELLPALKWVRGEALSQDHWIELFRLIGLPKSIRLEQLNFGDLLSVSKSIVAQSAALKTLTQRAQAEVVVREALQELDVWGAGATFVLTEYIDSSGQMLSLIKDWKDIVSQVGDNMALLASLQDSPYFDSFADRANAWAQRLADLDHSLNGLQAVQRRWVYLEPIIGRGALPKEAARFSQVDVEFRRLLMAIKADNRVVSLVAGHRANALKEQLTNMQDQLARCQRALNEYLEEKRSVFPRFYFLGDDDLLEILGQATNPSVVQTHLRKLFQGIHHVMFEVDGDNRAGGVQVKKLKTMCSLDGEVVCLQKPIQLTPEVELWLGRLAAGMQATLSELLAQCLNAGSVENRGKHSLDPNAYPGQILALAEAINFSRNTEEALSCGRLSVLKKDLQAQLAAYTSVDLNALRSTGASADNAQENNALTQTGNRVIAAKLSALILDTIHMIDVVDQLIHAGAATTRDWAWQRQLRFYEGSSGRSSSLSAPRVCMVDAEFVYTFEYQGNARRLVHTPLTDKCYLTLTQAMRMGLGGNPYGPAGTGKTESVKALGGLMGRQVLVFNCDEGIDVRSMGRILVGIVKCGAWGCFDEFNRLEEAVLSAVSMQIQVIQDGLRSSSSHITLLNRSISLDPNSGLFITLNPAGKGYGGRQKLPDNLKQLFRPVAMSQPDVDLIAEMILFSEGFRHARLLGRKLVSVFALARQLLSVQQHYDWGLRALKTVLHGAGCLLHAHQSNHPDADPTTRGCATESRMVIRAARTNTLAKLTSADVGRFEALLYDVFPEAELHVSSSEEPELTMLTEALHAVVEENRMVLVEPQIQKALEVYEQTKQRMGVVLVGPSGCGKSTILRLLRMALAKVGRPLRYHVFNPKAMLRVQLLGRIDPDTREWTDGVLTYSARCVVKEDSSQSCWIVCDGDIDPEWVESLNSVLDDNRLLTLPNGERIQFGPNVNFLFETHELTQASPATVSRMGVVYVSEESTEPRALVGAWLAQQPEEDRDQLELLINQSFYTCLDWVYQKNDFVLETSPAATVFNGLSHLVGATTPAQFAVGMIRGLGANLTETSREALALQVYEVTGETPPDPTRPLDVQVDKNCPSRLISYPPGTSIVLLGPGSLSNTAGGCTEFSSTNISTDSAFAHAAADGLASGYPPLVLTPAVRRSIDAFRCWLDDPKARQSFLLVGPEGCGKSRLLDYCFAMFNRSAQVATIQCSAQTTPIHLLEKLSQCCMTVTSSTAGTIAGRVLRPREGERLILYLRDLNLAKPDKWGSCQLTAFLQQLLTYHGYYDPVNLEFVGVEGIQFVGSITPATTSAGLGRHLLSPRFTSALRLTVITYPERDQLISIYTCLLQTVVHSHLATKDTFVCDSRASKYTVQAHSTKTPPLLNPVRLHIMASIMVQLLDNVQQQFRADEHAHCVFTPHLLTRWTAGLLRYELNGSVSNLWAAFGQEARCVLRNRLPGERARRQFDTLLSGLVYSNLSNTTTHGEFSGGDEIQTILKFATGEVDELHDFCGESENLSDKSSEQAGWFVSWGAKESAPPGSPMPPHGRPLGFMPMSHIKEVCERGLTQISREQCPKAAGLALFPEFIDLICRIERALTRPAGSLLLAGRSGIGRRSALNLVAHLHQFAVHRLRAGCDYTVRHFVGDVKVACQAAGIDSQPTVLLIEDHQLTHDAMLEIINSLLACGEASGLFTADELEALATNTPPTGGVSLREAAAEASHRGPISSFFAQRVRANLHFVIILDVDDSDQLTARLRANPSTYKHCEVQWVDNWTRNSLLNLPKLLISAVRVLPNVEKFCQAFTSLHNTAPHLYMATPRRYLALCAAYAQIEQTHRSKLEARASRLQAGLAKLKEARQRVCQLKKSAAEQGEQLAEKQTAADKALEQISAAMQGAAEQRTEMENLRNRVAEESKNLERRKAAIDTELSEIEPLVQQARAAVGSIRPEALSEIRALRAPPDVIRDILEGVLLLMGIRDTSWVSMRGFLAKRGVQEEILTFDARKISTELRTSVEKLLAKNQDSFDPKIAKRASVAAAPLANWVRANVKYATVLERIAPLEAEQAQLQASLSQAESALKGLAEELAGVDDRVGQLRAVFEQHTAEATRLKVELDRAKETLASAEALVGELEGEHARWKKQINELTVQLTALPPLALLSAAFITYLSASPEDVRKSQMCEWVRQLTALGMTIPNESLYMQASSDPSHFDETKGFDVLRFLTTEREQLVWRNQGLPSDQLSTENAVVILEWINEMTGTGMCPFIVDPSSRALNWLKQHLRERKVEVVSQRSSNFTTTLELAVRFGKSLIIQEVDEIEPILFPLLSGSLVFQGGRSTVLLGDKTVDYHPDFRLFLCTRQTPTSIGTIRPASASSLVTVVNFVTTRAGLVNQLLAASLHHERPQMEERRQNLVREEERMKLELAKLEDDLLEALANAHGNILENKELLHSLNKTKQSSMTISDSLKESSRLQAELDKERDVFYPLAEAGSRVYFALTELVKINWMYQFSLNSFLHLFEKALEAVYDPSLPTAGKVAFLQKRLEALTFAHVSQALFKADRPMFTMHMARCLRPEAITEEEWQFFTGLTVTDPQIDTKSVPSWLDPDRVRDVLRFKAALPAIYSALRLDEARIWSGWMSHHRDGGLPPPASLQSAQLTPFQLDVLAVQALRPDRLQTAMLQFANRCLDLPHLGSSTVNLSRLYEHETRATEPILLLISPGADPSQELAEAAAARFGNQKDSSSLADSHYRQVAMGQGQADLAISELHAAAEAGDWLCLKNLHLVIPWLPTLEKEINSLLLSEQVSANEISNKKNTGDGPVHIHQNFRLWLTAEPHAGFPSALLQTCLKVAYEAPPGLKRNLRRTYESWTRSYLAQGNSSNRATTLAALAWFHAVVQERRSYIPQGWTKFYEFSYADLRAAADVIDRLLLPSGSKAVVKDVWAWIHGLFEGTVYGGRMDNQSDVLVLQSYLAQMFSDETLRSLKLGPLRLPGTTDLKDYTTLIESLPDYDQPSNFNLPANIDRSAQRSAANRVIAQLRLLSRTVGKTSKFDKAVWSQELGPILVLWKKLNQGAPLLQRSTSANPESSKLRSAMSTTLKMSSLSGISKESPVVEFLRLELHNALHLVHTVHAGLAGLSRACRGTQLVTAALRQLAESLLHGETPDSWLAEWPEGPEEPVSFLRDLVAKAVAVQNLMNLAETKQFLQANSPPIDLADLFRPTTFLNSVRQQTGRQLGVAIDTLKLVCAWPGQSNQSSRLSEGHIPIRIAKLKLEGAAFESDQLAPSQPESPSLVYLPELTLVWIEQDMPDFLHTEASISLPVYLDSARQHLVTYLRVPCPIGTQNQWIQAGTALLLTSL
ncbi:Cytoplasmic dynein 2 heavy chain 1, variant 2 [Clonorchis sinensis]|uniref:Cytoplasmic dynein 2 heavy chain 1 n=3 Tax=Clonorchis sinensis TaxID=79923 RepID=A0A8T1M7D4_CLOSI|nr:Cytoplasmic dynein 2 heavy chain 1, variant 2 [Clonorchis sinensis]